MPSDGQLGAAVIANKALFIGIHIGALAGFLVGTSVVALLACFLFYEIRLFAITAGYHRLLSHRSYKTKRWLQFVLAFLGATTAQKGPLWWAAVHRCHHRYADTEKDPHSPKQRGLWWSHVGWILSRQWTDTPSEFIRDLSMIPELRLLDRFNYIPPLLFLAFTGLLGWVLQRTAPQLGSSPLQMACWAGLMSTVLVYHSTFAINSFAHTVGNRRFATRDTSRNNPLLALITLGEGWHNNHHRYPGSERQGLLWWEVDVTHYLLRLFSCFGVVWGLHQPPPRWRDTAVCHSQGSKRQELFREAQLR